MLATPSRAGFLATLGSAPALAPLDMSVRETRQFPTYRQQSIEYASVGAERVQAFLLTPRSVGGSALGSLAIHQAGGIRPYACGEREPAGLSGDPELAYGVELCRRGYVVLCPNRFGFETRNLAYNSGHTFRRDLQEHSYRWPDQ